MNADTQPIPSPTGTPDPVRQAAQALVDVLEAIDASPSYRGAWSYLWVHGYRHTGPNWDQPLQQLKHALRDSA